MEVLTLAEPNWSEGTLEAYGKTARAIGTLVRDHEDLLRGLTGLAQLGGVASEAIAAVRDLPDVRKIRLGWELFETLTQGDGLEPEVFMFEVLPFEMVELLTSALAVEAS